MIGTKAIMVSAALCSSRSATGSDLVTFCTCEIDADLSELRIPAIDGGRLLELEAVLSAGRRSCAEGLNPILCKLHSLRSNMHSSKMYQVGVLTESDCGPFKFWMRDGQILVFGENGYLKWQIQMCEMEARAKHTTKLNSKI